MNANAAVLPIGSTAATIVFSNQTSGLYLERSAVVNIASRLCDSVESCNLAWTTGGKSNWYYQTSTSHDGIDSARSGTISTNQDSWMETTVTGPARLTFYWKVSCNPNLHGLHLTDNGNLLAKISGVVDWTPCVFELSDGPHTLRWGYINKAL